MNFYLNKIFKSFNKLVKLGTFLYFYYIMKSVLWLQHTQAEFLNERPNFGRSRSKSPGPQEPSLFQVLLAMYDANSCPSISQKSLLRYLAIPLWRILKWARTGPFSIFSLILLNSLLWHNLWNRYSHMKRLKKKNRQVLWKMKAIIIIFKSC